MPFEETQILIFEAVPNVFNVGQPITGLQFSGFGFESVEILSLRIFSDQFALTIPGTQCEVDGDDILTVITPIIIFVPGTYAVELDTVLGKMGFLDGAIQVRPVLGRIKILESPRVFRVNEIIPRLTIQIEGFANDSVARLKFTSDGFDFNVDVADAPAGTVTFEASVGLGLGGSESAQTSFIILQRISFSTEGKYAMELYDDVFDNVQLGPTVGGAVDILPPLGDSMTIERLSTSLIQPGDTLSASELVGKGFTLEDINRLTFISNSIIDIAGNTASVVLLKATTIIGDQDAVPAFKFFVRDDNTIHLGPFVANVPGEYGVLLERQLSIDPAPKVYKALVARAGILAVRDTTKPVIKLTPPPGVYCFPNPTLNIQAQKSTIDLAIDLPAKVYFTLDGTSPDTTESYAFPPKDLSNLVYPVVLRTPTIVKAVAVDAAGNVSDIIAAFYFVGYVQDRMELGTEDLILNYLRATNTNDVVKLMRIRYKAVLAQDDFPGGMLVQPGMAGGKAPLLRDLRRALLDLLHEVGLRFDEVLAPPVIQFVNDRTIRVKPGREIFTGIRNPNRVSRRGEEIYGKVTATDPALTPGNYTVIISPSPFGMSYYNIRFLPTTQLGTITDFFHIVGNFDVDGNNKIVQTSISNIIDAMQRPKSSAYTDPDIARGSPVIRKDIHWRELEIGILNATLPGNIELGGDTGVRPGDPVITPSQGDRADRPRGLLPPTNIADQPHADTEADRARSTGDTANGPRTFPSSFSFRIVGRGLVQFNEVVPMGSGTIQLNGFVTAGSTFVLDKNAKTLVGGPDSTCSGTYHFSGPVRFGSYQSSLGLTQWRQLVDSGANSINAAAGLVFRVLGPTNIIYTCSPGLLADPGAPSGIFGGAGHAGFHVKPTSVNFDFPFPYLSPSGAVIIAPGSGSTNPVEDNGVVLGRAGQNLSGTPAASVKLPTLQLVDLPFNWNDGLLRWAPIGGTVMNSVNPGSVVFSAPAKSASGASQSQSSAPAGLSGGGFPPAYSERSMSSTAFSLVGNIGVTWSGSVTVKKTAEQTVPTNHTISVPDLAANQVTLEATGLPVFQNGGVLRLEIPQSVRDIFTIQLWTGTTLVQDADFLPIAQVAPGGRVQLHIKAKASLLGNLRGIQLIMVVTQPGSQPIDAQLQASDTEITLTLPDSASIEVVAAPIADSGSQINMRAQSTIDGTPVVEPLGAQFSGYTAGAGIRFTALPVRRVVEIGQVSFIRSPIYVVVEAVNVIHPEQKAIKRLKINFLAKSALEGLGLRVAVNNEPIDIPPEAPKYVNEQASVLVTALSRTITVAGATFVTKGVVAGDSFTFKDTAGITHYLSVQSVPAETQVIVVSLTPPDSATAYAGGNPQFIAVTTRTQVAASGRIITTTKFVGRIDTDDLDAMQALMPIISTGNASGDVNIQKAIVFDAPMPGLPGIGVGPIVNLRAGDVLGLEFPLSSGIKAIARGGEMRGNLPQRVFRAHVRAVDDENEANVHEALVEITFGQQPGIRQIDILVGVNGVFRPISELTDTTFAGNPAKSFQALDKDQVELLAVVHGNPAGFAVIRSFNVPQGTPPPSVAPLKNITQFDARGQPQFSDTSFIIGTFRNDKRVSLLPVPIDPTRSALLAQVSYGVVSGMYFRQTLSNNGALRLYADATNIRNLQNALDRTSTLIAEAPLVIQDITFRYLNSRNPDQILPIAAGSDVNGTITGAGTSGNPFIIPVDKPEQFEIFATPLFDSNFPTPFAYMQGNVSFDPNQMPPLLPPTDERLAFGKNLDGTLMKFTVLPAPTSKGRDAPRPSTGGELITNTGNTNDGGQPSSNTNGISRVYLVRVRAEGVGNANNVVQKDLYFRIKDPAVV